MIYIYPRLYNILSTILSFYSIVLISVFLLSPLFITAILISKLRLGSLTSLLIFYHLSFLLILVLSIIFLLIRVEEFCHLEFRYWKILLYMWTCLDWLNLLFSIIRENRIYHRFSNSNSRKIWDMLVLSYLSLLMKMN